MKKILLFIMLTVMVISLITPLASASPLKNAKYSPVSIDSSWREKIPNGMFQVLDEARNIKAAISMPTGLRSSGLLPLFNAGKAYHIIVVGEDSGQVTSWIIKHSLKLLYKAPLLGGRAIYYVVATRKQVEDIAKINGVYRITPSLPLSKLLDSDAVSKAKLAGTDVVKTHTVKPVLGVKSDTEVSYLTGVQLIGATKVWEEYNITGKGVVVGIVDTGTDFSEPELGVEAIAREPDGTPLLMSMVNGLTLTYRTVTAVNDTLQTAGMWTLAFDPLWSYVYGQPVMRNFTFTTNITISPNMTSQSGVYHIGVAPFLFQDSLTGYVIEVYTTVVVYDSQTPGVYDKAVFDLSTSFYSLSELMQWLENNVLGTTYWRTPNSTWNDNSMADEPVFGPGNEVVARDFDGDSIPDYSIGTIAGYYADFYGLTNISVINGTLVPGQPGLYPGFDPNGNFLALVQDWQGHGTSVATVIAARGRFNYDIYGDGKLYKIIGVAPNATLAGGDAWWLGDILLLEAWLAGFDLEIQSEGGYTYISLNPFGPHRADIISNSWSHIYVNFWMQQFPGIDVSSEMMDAILTVRNYFLGDPVIIVFAAGNEGPGYSSIGTPSAGLLVVSVGASTLWDWIRIYGYPPGYSDEIIPFSSRGPTGLGYPKPDVVNIGAYEWAGQRTIDGRGYGAGFDLFGGTSEATPFTSGSLALILQAYNMTHGYKPDVVTAKILLKSTAKDIGYNAFAQGSGRVDVYRAVKTVMNGGWLAYIPEGIQEAFTELYANDYGSYLGYVINHLADTAYYGVVPPGTTKTFTLFLRGFGEAHISAWNTVLTKEYTVFSGVFKYDHMMFKVVPKWVYKDADFIEVVVHVKNITPPLSKVTVIPPDDSHEIILSAYDWIDDNGDGQIGYPSELRYINFESRVSTEAFLTISNPAQKIHGDLVLRLRPNPSAQNITPAQLEIIVRAYKKVPCKVISFTNTSLDVYGIANVTGIISIPKNFRPGLLEVRIEVDTPTKKIVIPASILVPLVLDNVSSTWLGGVRSPMKYDPFALYGLSDVGYGVWEGQDWRLLPVMITDPSISGAVFIARWSTGATTDLSFLAEPPGGASTPTGEPNVFAAYKLAYDLGQIYNPSLSDQLQGKLRVFLPTRWPSILQNIPVFITSLSSWPPYPGLAYAVNNDKLPEIYGVYRIIYSLTAYNGKALEEKVSFRIITVKAETMYDEVGSVGNISYGYIHVEFEAGAYTPFLFSDIYITDTNGAVTPLAGEAGYPVFISLFENGTAGNTINYFVLYNFSTYLGWSPLGKYVALNIPVMINMTAAPGDEVDVLLVIYDYPWRSEGRYLYSPDTGELCIASYWHPGMPVGQLFF